MNKIVEGLESEPPPLTPVDTAVGIEADFRKVSLPRDDNWAAGLVGRRVDLKEPTESDSDNPTLEPRKIFTYIKLAGQLTCPAEKRGKGIYGPGNVYEDHGTFMNLPACCDS